MSRRVVDLPRVHAALRALDLHVSEHPCLTDGDAPERLAAHLEAEEPDLTADTDEPRKEPRPAGKP